MEKNKNYVKNNEKNKHPMGNNKSHMETTRKINWVDLLIVLIAIIAIILFAIWVIKLSNREISNSLDVLTDKIFSENLQRMKEVGKEYFTTERLPEKVGDVKTLTLEEMYNKNLILELTDKYGNSCSEENSYVSIEKHEKEYQMKVYLECGEEQNYIIVIMGCYDYCNTDICESKENSVEDKFEGNQYVDNKLLEYEYKKSTDGKWNDWGTWTEWSKTLVTSTDYREVETKIENEEYTYDKTNEETIYTELDATCPDGYTMNSKGTNCYKTEENTSYKEPTCGTIKKWTNTGRDGFTCNYIQVNTSTKEPTCPYKEGWTNTGRDGIVCTYSKTTTVTVEPVCPSVSGWTNTGRNGFTCNYSKPTTSTTNPVCPNIKDWTNTGRNGFTCSYSKTTTSSAEPVCPSKSGWNLIGRNGFTCNYSKTVASSNYTLSYSHTATGSSKPGDTSTHHYEQISADYVYSCSSTCGFRWVITYKVYNKVYGTITETTTAQANCPSGYSNVNGICTSSTTETKTETASCPSGYNNVNGTCTKNGTYTKTESATCPKDYDNVDGTCTKSNTSTKAENGTCPKGYSNVKGVCVNGTTETKTETASCPSGYKKDTNGNRCYKTVASNVYKALIKSCPDGYTKTSDGSKCYQKALSTETITTIREVTYYRYRIREYTVGTVDYKWSKSKEDKTLLNDGYVLTGRTR